jgi:hypothetical protein
LKFEAFCVFRIGNGGDYLQPPNERLIDNEKPVLQVVGFGVHEVVGAYPPVLHDGAGAV